MAAIIPSIAAFGFRIGRGIIGLLAASQVLDILSGGAPSQAAISNISQQLGKTVTAAEVSDMVRKTNAQYVIVHTPTNTIVKVISKATVFRLLTARRRKPIEKKVIVVSGGGHHGGHRDINEGNVEVIR